MIGSAGRWSATTGHWDCRPAAGTTSSKRVGPPQCGRSRRGVATPQQCNDAQVAAVCSALDYALAHR
ncbi:hypothetical protein GUM64_13675 [Stenotrophomonas maltophilia]|nr:hypothetical protein [Stenotrophomonas maltophilia]MCF3541967.1 hypothetical protein [Stenotrophomonas maltophilia]NRP01329.1 hypothetical protein [Stenotrophomonas maltophilia]